MENDKLLHKWVNGDLTAEELEEFKRRPEYESLVTLYRNTEDFAAPDFDDQGMLTEILQADKSTAIPSPSGRRILLTSWLKYGVAASVLLLAGWFIWTQSNTTVNYDIAQGERKEGTLPDGSTFVLNAESNLNYNAKDWEKERKLFLRGEAFFTVKEGSTFQVMTKEGIVQVLGTQFNVWSRRATLEVKCKSGKVAVTNKQGKSFAELKPNEALRITSGKLVEQWIIPNYADKTWVEGLSSFRKVPLKIVLEEIERQFEVKFTFVYKDTIDTEEIINCNFPNDNLDLALKSALTPLGIDYKFKGLKEILLL